MKPWRVTAVDADHRYVGFAAVLARTPTEASAALTDYFADDPEPYEVSDVRPHEHPEPHVLVFNWGE